MSYSFFIPVKPVAWSRPRFNSRTHSVFNAKPLRDYEAGMRLTFKSAINSGAARRLSGALKVSLRFYLEPPKKKVREYPSVRPDIDNFSKAVLDSANDVLWDDDAQICDLTTEKVYCAGLAGIKMGVMISVEEIKGERSEI